MATRFPGVRQRQRSAASCCNSTTTRCCRCCSASTTSYLARIEQELGVSLVSRGNQRRDLRPGRCGHDRARGRWPALYRAAEARPRWSIAARSMRRCGWRARIDGAATRRSVRRRCQGRHRDPHPGAAPHHAALADAGALHAHAARAGAGVRPRARRHRQDLSRRRGCRGDADDRVRSIASSCRAPRSRRASGWASCPATCARRSIPICARSTTRCYDMLPGEQVVKRLTSRRDRDGAAGLHARPHAGAFLRHPRRGAEHHADADEDVPDPPRRGLAAWR